MQIRFDPALGPAFWEQISHLPGYPSGEAIPLRQMMFEPGALFKLGEALKGAGADPAQPVLVVMDPTPMRRGADSLKPLCLQTLRSQGWQVESEIVEPDASGPGLPAQVHTDLAHIQVVQSRLRPDLAVVALGSGVICDITKHACYLFAQQTGHNLPFVVFQTANSVSAFTSNMAPTFIDGVKRTLESRYPDALVCDLETLRDAPPEMTAAGVGDLLAAFVSFPDWRLAYCLGLDKSYSELPQTLMGPLDEIFLSQAEAIRRGSLEAVAILAKLISLGGLAMSLTHATTPMSGYEHVMSHMLDLLAENAHRPLAIHGAQVGLTSLLGAAAYQRFLVEFDPAALRLDACYPADSVMQAEIQRKFERIDPSGKAGAECWADYRQKLDAWRLHRPEFEAFLQDWPAIWETLRKLSAPPVRLAEILQAVGAPRFFPDLVPPGQEEEVRFAFLNAPLMRKRFTLGDLLIFTGWDREKLWRQAREVAFPA